MKNLLAVAPLHVSGLLALLVACEALGASVRSPGIRADGRFQIQFDAVPGSYAILFRGTSVTTIQNAVALSQTATGLITLIDPEPTPGSSNRFYRVQWVPLDLPRDVDGDGMSDVFELKYQSILNPLNPADRDLDSDGDGRSNFTESLAGTDPSVRDAALTRVETSPFQGASGISVTRETIFRFSQPLASNTTLATNVVYAEVGSRRILSRAELASDRRKITLFYLEPLPASARVRARLDGNQLRDETGSLVDGDGDGVAGGWTEIQFDTMSSVLLTGTAVSGYVYDSAPQQTPSGLTNKPIVGAIVTIDGNEQVGRAVTDSRGFFILNPCPSGRFFVHIDGREAVGSSWPDGAYYPFVGKTFEGVVGQTNPVPGGVVYLPLVAASTLKPVSALTTTTVEFPASVLAGRPELAGVKVTVPANSLFADDGTRGGSVGIAPVPPDRIPSPLPPGLTPPIVITVQTDGPANFDRPVPVQFPNLPDPRTGKVLAPGERSILWSFNHDSGQWEPQGTMTVSADGKFLASDPGVGVLQPGWLAAYPAGQPIPPPNNCPVGSLAKEYLEAQLKEAECMLRMAALLTLPGPSLQTPKLLNLAATLPSLASSMSQSLANLASAVQAGQPAGVVGALFGILGANMNAISQVGSARATTSGTPVQQLLKSLSDLLVCLLELAKEQLDFSCGIVPCLFSNHPNFANQMALCNTMQTGVQQALNAISAYQFKTGSGFTRLTIAMQQLGSLITAYGGTPAGPNALDPHTPGPRLAAAAPLPDQIQAQIKEVLDALAEFQKDVQPETDLANQMAGTLNTYSNVLASLDGPALLRLSAHANGYYKLTSGGFVARGRTTPSGALDLPMINFFEAYSLLIYDPLRNAISEGNAPAPGLSVQPVLPDPVLRIPGINDLSGDTDGDGLTDLAEDVIGTRRDVKDTDGDGISDFTEVQQGRNPLNGIALPTGPVSALPLAGTSKSIDIVDTTAYLAQGTAGMAVVDLTNPLSPIAISQFALPGDSYDIAYSPTARTAGLIAYASDAQISQGELYQMHVVDLTDPTRPRLLRNSLISANSIQENGGVFYTAVGNEVRMYDAVSGLEIGWFSVNAPVTGILPTESEIFVTTAGNLFVYQKALSSPALKGSIAGKFAAADIQSKVHMVLDGTRLWVGTAQGLLAVDIANRNAPKVLNQPGILPRAFRTLALSAAKRAIGLTTTLPNALNFGGQTSIFDISDPTSTNKLNLLLNARGRTYDSAMLSGWWVLADGQAGLTVMNLVSLDTAGQAPSVTWLLDTNDADAAKQGVQMVEGRRATFRPTVTDDVEVDFTELLVNGSVADVSRVIPPVFEFQLPLRTQNITQITAQIQSRDRSGNLGSSDSVTIELIADTVSPAVLSPTQQSGFAAFSNWPLVFRFSEDLLPEAWQASAMNLLSYGPNGVIGGGDDVTIQLASANVTGASASVIPASPLTFGRYRLTIPRGQIRDAVSNAPPSDLVLEFSAFVTDPATAVWISPNPGRYHDAANWLRARVPGQENVLIQLPGATPNVTLDAGAITKDVTIGGSLTMTSRFAGLTIRYDGMFKGPVQASGGSINVMKTARFDTDVSLQGVDVSVSGTLDTRGKTTLNGGSMSLSGANATWLRPGGIESKNASILVRDGAVAQFQEFTSLQSDGDFTGLFPFASSFTAIGTGSKLVFPNVLSGTGPTGSSFTGAPSLEFSASGGGVIEVPLLQSLTGRLRVNADGTDSKLELPKLTRVEGPVDFASQINAFNFAEIRAPLLASLKKCDVRLTDSVLRVSQIQIESANNLRGYGTILGNVEIQGSLLLDFAGGSLIVDGNLTFASGSIYSPALGQTFGPAFVEVRKQAVLNGKLKPTLERGFTVTKGNTFIVGKFPGGVTGTFAQLDPSALGSSVVFDAPMASGNLSVRITGP